MHFNGRFVLTLIQQAGSQGADLGKLLSLTGKSAEELGAKECRLGAEVYNTVVEKVVQETGDEFFGMHAAETMNLSAAGLVIQIVQSSENVRQALEYCCEFSNLGCSALPATLVEKQDYYYYTFTPDPSWLLQHPLSVRQTLEGYLAFMVREFRSLTHSRKSPVKTLLTFPAPKNRLEPERILGCPVAYDCDVNAVVLEKSHVEEKVTTNDYDLLNVLINHAYQKLAEFEASSGFYETVKRSVINMVKPDFPTLDEVAGHLNMSTRSLQRKLKEEGYSYKEVLEELKKDFAIGYLHKPELSIGQIAYLLNYAEPSAFIRSFKRWTGQTPNSYRAAII